MKPRLPVGMHPPLLSVGFRLFFLLGSTHAIWAVAVWTLVLRGGIELPLLGLPATRWHGHEMVYGFSVAVIAGFLLTAVKNWTKNPTLVGWPLAALGVLWSIPRVVGPFLGPEGLVWMGTLDLLFNLGLFVAIARPVILARQARQAGIVSKVAFLGVGQALFYAGALGWLEPGVSWGLGVGLYMVLALMITVAARVMVFFIRSTLPDVTLTNTSATFDRVALLAFLALFVLDVFTDWAVAVSAVAALLAGLHSYRLRGWWTFAALTRSLLWVLYLSYAWIIAGFVLQAATPWLGLSPWMALHAFAVGGIGTLTAGMMARVSLGHTGRDVRSNRPFLTGVFAFVTVASLARVLGPWLHPTGTALWWSVAAACWGVGFTGLWFWAVRFWVLPRPDQA